VTGLLQAECQGNVGLHVSAYTDGGDNEVQ
jgi:hypothetical protein